MELSRAESQSLIQAAFTALRSGDAMSAKASFDRVIEAGYADPTAMLGLAFACRSLQDFPACQAAADNVLALDRNNLWALLLKADACAATGDSKAAVSYYQAMIKAASQTQALPADLQRELSRAKAMCDKYANLFEQHLENALKEVELPAGSRTSDRFAESMDLLFGKKQIYLQSPKFYYFPRLPHIQFFDREPFPWLRELEQATPVIREELLNLLKNDSLFSPYVQMNGSRHQETNDPMLNNPNWSAFYLWKNGEAVAENIARCPKTVAALSHVPVVSIPGRSPSVLFSLLRPGAKIPPHNGFVNTRLICHLPLIVPPNCGFRVGNETRNWKEGEAWLFDDTIEHEAWNLSEQTRVILLFEVWRPELTASERMQISRLFEAIDQYGDGLPDWGI